MKNQQVLINEMCPSAVYEWVKKSVLLVDVREEAEVEQLAFDVPEIVNIPLSEFENRYKEIPLDKMVVMVCHSGNRSLPAAGFLVMNGYDPLKVVNMKQGIIRWVQHGLPVTGDVSQMGNDEHECDCGSHAHDHSCDHV